MGTTRTALEHGIVAPITYAAMGGLGCDLTGMCCRARRPFSAAPLRTATIGWLCPDSRPPTSYNMTFTATP